MMSLLRIMYAPLDYIHPKRFPRPVEALSPAVQQAVNHRLIQEYQLTTKLDFSTTPNDFSQQLVVEWSFLPKVAWLIGCKLTRGNLAVSGRLATLPDVARRFVALPVPCPSYPSDLAVSESDLEKFGARYLFQLQPNLPVALAERLPLLFAPEPEHKDSTNEAQIDLTLNRSLLTFAFDYAKNSSN